MPWPLMVLDWSRHQLPRTGVRCILASRHASAAVGNTVVRTVVGGAVTPIRRETLKVCTRPPVDRCLVGARVRQSGNSRQVMQ